MVSITVEETPIRGPDIRLPEPIRRAYNETPGDARIRVIEPTCSVSTIRVLRGQLRLRRDPNNTALSQASKLLSPNTCEFEMMY